MFKKMKDKALSEGAKIAINRQIEDYGKVQSLYLDSHKKSIELEILLKGELEMLHVYVNNYELSETDDHHQLKVNGVTTSRAWINTVASCYLEGRTFDIPNEYAKIFKVVI